MKNFVFILLAIVGLTSCNSSQSPNSQSPNKQAQNNQGNSAQTFTKAAQNEYVEVLYFFGKQRCISCNAIEKLTKELIEEDFSKELKNGKVVIKLIDISTKEGEEIANKYEVAWSSLYVNKWKDGEEIRNNITDFAFSSAKNTPDVFKAGLKEKVEEYLK